MVSDRISFPVIRGFPSVMACRRFLHDSRRKPAIGGLFALGMLLMVPPRALPQDNKPAIPQAGVYPPESRLFD